MTLERISYGRMNTGASIGQGFYENNLGRPAKWIGAGVGLLPDLDVFLSHNPIDAWITHRGYTHTLPVSIFWGVVMGWIFWKLWHRRCSKQSQKPTFTSEHKPSGLTLPSWIFFMILVLGTHPLLDIFTSYGTQLLLPFTNKRYALDGVMSQGK